MKYNSPGFALISCFLLTASLCWCIYGDVQIDKPYTGICVTLLSGRACRWTEYLFPPGFYTWVLHVCCIRYILSGLPGSLRCEPMDISDIVNRRRILTLLQKKFVIGIVGDLLPNSLTPRLIPMQNTLGEYLIFASVPGLLFTTMPETQK